MLNRSLLRLLAQYKRRTLRFVNYEIEDLMTLVARPPRADAQRNRERLLRVAVAEFAEHGQDVPLETIAARAGVGIGTLYRHFPNREALIVAAYQQEVDSLCASAPELIATMPADQALRTWAVRFTDYVATKRAMGDALRSAVASDASFFSETKQRISGALRLLLEAGAASGALRPDSDPDDVMRVMSAIWFLPDGPEWRRDVGRMLDLVIDGLRYRATEDDEPRR